MYKSTKIFENFSVSLRQHKAAHSHCQLLHGYALKFKVWFEADSLDEMNWVVDFGGFKDAPQGNGLKQWMNNMFDHTLLIEQDDPYLDIFQQLEQMKICKLVILEKAGCESLAKMVYDKFNERLSKTDAGRARVVKVEVFENDKNSAIYEK